MGIYITIPQTVEAMQYNGKNAEEIFSWSEGLHVNIIAPEDRGDDPECDLELLSSAHSNWIPIYVTDWIVRKDGTQYMRVNDKTFKANYQEKK
jgi:hypothetical protein